MRQVAEQGAPAELALLIAVDVSASIDAREYALQANGLAAAFGDMDVQDAIARMAPGGVTVSVMQWSGAAEQYRALDWTRLTGRADAEAFALRLAAMPRLSDGGDTRIASALTAAARILEDNPILAGRRVIDINSDGGVEAIGITRAARDRVIGEDVTVNGLAIESAVLDLAGFFHENIIGGPGAFAMRIDGYDDFAEAMRRKLIRELTERPMA